MACKPAHFVTSANKEMKFEHDDRTLDTHLSYTSNHSHSTQSDSSLPGHGLPVQSGLQTLSLLLGLF